MSTGAPFDVLMELMLAKGQRSSARKDGLLGQP
jgi:hypothetical protein